MKVSNGTDTYEVDEANLAKAQEDGFQPVVSVSNGKQHYDVHPDQLEKAAADGFKPIPSVGETVADYAASALPIATSIGGGALGSMLGPAGSVAGASVGNLTGHQVEKYIRDKFMGQKQQPTTGKEVAWDLATGAVGGLGGVALKSAAKVVPAVAESAAMQSVATSPLPTTISNATNVVGGSKNLISKLSNTLGDVEGLPTVLKNMLDFSSGVAGRVGAYSNKFTGIPQAISDASKGVSYGQKALAYVLDKAPQYSKALEGAAKAGGNALGTTMFILSQKDPEFQKVMKDMREGE